MTTAVLLFPFYFGIFLRFSCLVYAPLGRSNHYTGFKASLTMSKVLVYCNNHSSQLKRVSSICSFAFLCSISVLFFSSQKAPVLTQFSFAELLELLHYDNKKNVFLVQSSSLCLTSRDKGKPQPCSPLHSTSQIASP